MGWDPSRGEVKNSSTFPRLSLVRSPFSPCNSHVCVPRVESVQVHLSLIQFYLLEGLGGLLEEYWMPPMPPRQRSQTQTHNQVFLFSFFLQERENFPPPQGKK